MITSFKYTLENLQKIVGRLTKAWLSPGLPYPNLSKHYQCR